MKFFKGLSFRAPLILALMIATSVHADVVINGTRFVYPAQNKEITVKLSNAGDTPVLVQSWIDDGNDKATPETVDVPFNLAPPIARIEKGKSQTLRLSFTGKELPQDRETVYWLNVLEVPPRPADAKDDNYMQLAFRYRVKIFYRPKGLPGSANDAPGKLTWSVSPTEQAGSARAITAKNDTPYYISLNDVKVTDGSALNQGEIKMIAPMSSQVITLKNALPSDVSRLKVEYKSINDWGAFTSLSAPLKQ